MENRKGQSIPDFSPFHQRNNIGLGWSGEGRVVGGHYYITQGLSIAGNSSIVYSLECHEEGNTEMTL